MLTEKQIEDVIEELGEIEREAAIAYKMVNLSLLPKLAVLLKAIGSRSRNAIKTLKTLKTEEPQSRDCW